MSALPQLERQQEARVSPIIQYLTGLLERFAALDDGAVASYIPELARSNPDHFGICIATLDGAVYEVGDTRVPFTIQSMSKPLTYGLALERLGEDIVHRRVGVEPSGDPFNEISLAPATGAPVNPMINAGAIACAGMVAALDDAPLTLLLEAYSRYAGRAVAIDDAVYLSEKATGHRNRAIAHLLGSFDLLDVAPEAAVDLYFRQCAVSVDCRDLALIASTLANGGMNPVSRERAVGERVVRGVLSVMTTCGMYDAAGDWLMSVGLPAKSGVSGGVFAVLPGRLGIGVYSPALDERGNSVRGVAVCRALSKDLALHLVRPGERTAPPVRGQHELGALRSKRVRQPAQREAIVSASAATAIFELQGELGFMAAEAISRRLTDARTQPDLVVVDLLRVARSDRGGIEFLSALGESLNGVGGALAVSGAAGDLELELPDVVLRFVELDEALEWCEDELLGRVGHLIAPTAVPLERHELFSALDPTELERLAQSLGTLEAGPGTVLVRAGDQAGEVFLVTDGALSVFAPVTGRRLSTLSAGMTFGELGYLERGPRTADVRADTDVCCTTLPYEVLDDLAVSDPRLHAKLLHGFARVVVTSLKTANAEVAHLTR
ncbi:MAG TPA: glutaminase A [Gaiellaceae bacterium]|jgi:glutaminase|nr:glutaminase A [Gaiellaceae bacterium]